MEQIDFADTITALDPAQWDTLAASHAPATYGWLKTMEEYSHTGGSTEYILLRSFGKLAGAAICYTEPGTGNVRDIDIVRLTYKRT